MSCICKSPVRPEFKDSYNDLLDKPQINGVTLSGNLTAADLGIKAGAQFKIVPQLPVTDIEESTIYLVPVQVGQTDNIYQEWIYINNKWEKIGEPISIEGSSGVESLNKIVNTPSITAEYSPGSVFMNDVMDGLGLKNNHIYLSHWGFQDPYDTAKALRFENATGIYFENIIPITATPNDGAYNFIADGDVFFCGEIQCCNNYLYYRGKFINANDFDHVYATIP